VYTLAVFSYLSPDFCQNFLYNILKGNLYTITAVLLYFVFGICRLDLKRYTGPYKKDLLNKSTKILFK